MKLKRGLATKTIAALILIPIYIGVTLALILAIVPASPDFGIKSIEALNGNAVYVEEGEEFPYLFKSDINGGYSEEPFKLLVFTDLHLDFYLKKLKKNQTAVDMMKQNIESERPDLVILDGDNVTSAFTAPRAKALAEMFEAYGVFWAPVYGNHDTENSTALSRERLTDIWSSYPHCLLRKGAVNGCGNYIINIKTSADNVSKSLIFMDSGAYLSQAEKTAIGYSADETVYDYIRPDQIEWYRDSVSRIQSSCGNGVKSLLFMHIALPEFEDAYTSGELIYGEMRETIGCSKINGGFFDVIDELDHTEAIFVGHDHINDFEAVYRGVRFVYCLASGYSSYDLVSRTGCAPEQRLQGATAITLYSDGEYHIDRITNAAK